MQRAYGYVYDPVNRLLQGDFVARNASTTPNILGAWRAEEDNYRLSFASYDDNGNLLSLRRRGLLANATHAAPKQYGPVDVLNYTYQGNRLQAVDDQVSTNQLPRPLGYEGAPTSLAGDFQEGGTRLGQEYGYDANGNLTQDRNKGITGIAYNHLNLPKQIHFGIGADSIVFRYTAAGQKVAKLVYQTGKPTLRTDYLGPYQYEQDSLRFFPHAEGRVLRFANTTSGAVHYEREFTFKDHLGNLRLAYRAGQRRTYTATLEQDATTHGRESQQFDSLSVSPPVAVPTGLARTGGYAARLNAGGSTPHPLGPLTQLTVQKGDTLFVNAPGRYQQATNNNSFAFSLAGFVASLLQPAPGAPTGLDGTRRGGLPLLQVGLSSATLMGLSQLPNGVPKAYLRVLSFNEDSVLVDQRTVQLSAAALNNYETLSTGQLIVQQNGYVSVYVGNESAADVYFDDVTIEHRQGLQVQENQYDPFGLDLAGVNYASPGLNSNKYQFNGKEKQDDLGLDWIDYGARMYEPSIARWHNIDASAANYYANSPFHFSGNNPLKFRELDGNDYGVSINRTARTITISAHFITNSANESAFINRGQNALNRASGQYVFVAGGVKALKQGKATVYGINVNITHEVDNGPTFMGQSAGQRRVRNDNTGTLNSFDTVKSFPTANQNGGTGNDEVNVLESKRNTGTTTHESLHALGNAHTSEGGSLSPTGGEQVSGTNIAETLAGVGIGGNNMQRNTQGASESVGDGTLLNNSSNSGLGQGKVISQRRYERIMQRLSK